jgi:hypothetical protein
MTCRASTAGVTCAGTPTGAALNYDNERRLVGWQSPGGGTSTASFAYNGEGNRVAQSQTIYCCGGSRTTTTHYIGEGEEQTGSALTKYYSVAGLAVSAVNVGGTISYLASDGLASVSEAVDENENALAQQLFAPCGGSRYSSGTMPTRKGSPGSGRTRRAGWTTTTRGTTTRCWGSSSRLIGRWEARGLDQAVGSGTVKAARSVPFQTYRLSRVLLEETASCCTCVSGRP